MTTPRRRRFVWWCAAVPIAALAAGCGGSGKSGQSPTSGSTVQPAAKRATPGRADDVCRPVPEELRRRILAHVILAKARLTKIRAVGASGTPGYYYVSGTIAGSGTKDLLATWVTKGLQSGRQIYSVDSNAALVSAYGASANLGTSLSIDTVSAYRSRVCVAGRHAPQGAPAPLSGGGAPAGN
jgi:hypothetical protein